MQRLDASPTAAAKNRRGDDLESTNGPPCAPEVWRVVRQTLIEQETTYQQGWIERDYSSLWAHSARVARIARQLAQQEGCDEEPAMLAGLMHDLGKFAHGRYHEDDTPEEVYAARMATRILTGTAYEKWIPKVNDAILSSYLDGEATTAIGRVVYDADCLDKLGNMGVAQFFAKRALRRQFLNEEVLLRTSIELTYAHHAPETLKTATGRALAQERSLRTRRFFSELLAEWMVLGLGAYTIREAEIAGIVCILVVPQTCSCGSPLIVDTDILDAVKCRSVVVIYRCPACSDESTISFCLPAVRSLPRKR